MEKPISQSNRFAGTFKPASKIQKKNFSLASSRALEDSLEVDGNASRCVTSSVLVLAVCLGLPLLTREARSGPPK
tara:strand:+ start:8919 stop:9143 length:225 start_codon:yes stop_codon:yes gene_type:complete